jgi:hypothetical protein
MKAPTAKQKAARAAFKKMIARAKQIRKASPNMQWKTAVKQAAKEQK